jgi:hypothetical protein
MSRRDDAIVAWHEVPGKAPPQKIRPVGYGVILAEVRTESIENAVGADISGIAKQVGAIPKIPKCLGGVSDHVHLCISLLQETVHSASSSSNKIGPLKKSI